MVAAELGVVAASTLGVVAASTLGVAEGTGAVSAAGATELEATGASDTLLVAGAALVFRSDCVVSVDTVTGAEADTDVSVFSSACALVPIMTKVPSNTEQTPTFNFRIENRLFFLLNKSLDIILHNNWKSHYPIALPK